MDYENHIYRDRQELLQRALRDRAVSEAVEAYKEGIPSEAAEIVHRVAALAAHNALERYAAEMKAEMSLAKAYFEIQYNKEMLSSRVVSLASLMAKRGSGLTMPPELISEPPARD